MNRKTQKVEQQFLPGRSGKPNGGSASWVPGERLPPTRRDPEEVRRRAPDILRWRRGGLSLSRLAQRLRVRIRAGEESVREADAQEGANPASFEQLALALPPTHSLPVRTTTTESEIFVPKYSSIPEIAEAFVDFILRRYSDANANRERGHEYRDPWEFVVAELERLDPLTSECDESHVTITRMDAELRHSRKTIAELEEAIEQWRNAHAARVAEIQGLKSACRSELEQRLWSHDLYWQRMVRNSESKARSASEALRGVTEQLASERSRIPILEELYFSKCDDYEKLEKAHAKVCDELGSAIGDVLTLRGLLVSRSRETPLPAAGSSSGSDYEGGTNT